MNRGNIWINIGIASVLVALAAILGQIDRWRAALQDGDIAFRNANQRTVTLRRENYESEPEVLVRFDSNVTPDQIRRIVSSHNDRIEDKIESVSGLYAIDDLDGVTADEVAGEYRRMSDLVVYAEPVMEISLDDPAVSPLRRAVRTGARSDAYPNDPEFSEQWALNNTGKQGGKENADISALKAWEKTQGSGEIVVAVLDTGVDYTHPDLTENMWIRPEKVPPYYDDELGAVDDVHGFDAETNTPDPMDDNGHGTHVAGIIGAEGDNGEGIAGINWKVKILPLKFLGRGGFGSTKNAIEAINYAIDRKKNGVNIRVINASWGSTQRSRALEDAIRAAGDAGILFVAAAGNNGTDNDRSPHYPSNYDLQNVISVAALDRNDNLANFSNFGLKTVHIAAPGREILSTWLGNVYREASGTSMAAPQVAGVAALILAAEPDLTLPELRKRLLKSVDKIDGLKDKIASGGRVNAAAALAVK